MKSYAGFALIEVLLSSAIAAMLSLLLFGILDQVNRLTTWSNSTMNKTIIGISIYNQLERDLAGAFVPEHVPREHALFECTEKEEMLQSLSFVTTNTVFTHTSCAPRMVRVVYRLLEDEKIKKETGKVTYLLTRQESPELDPKVFEAKNDKSIRSYVVARGIARCTATFLRVQITEEGKRTTEKSAIWPLKKDAEEQKMNSVQQSEKKDKDQPPLLLPVLAQINIYLDAGARKKPLLFTMSTAIFASEPKELKKPKLQQEPTLAEKKFDLPQVPIQSNAAQPELQQPIPVKIVDDSFTVTYFDVLQPAHKEPIMLYEVKS